MTKKYILVGTMLVLLGTSGCSYIPTENISYGVYYNDTDLSNTPKNELQARLQELNSKIPQTISIDMGNNKKQQATYHDLGIQIDTDAMVKAIMAMKMICGHYFQIDLMPYSTVIILNHNISLMR
jgi:hypothetical protein